MCEYLGTPYSSRAAPFKTFLQSLESIKHLSCEEAIAAIFLREHKGVDHTLSSLNRQAFPDKLYLSQLLEAR